jgi:uncharacterized membrane protein
MSISIIGWVLILSIVLFGHVYIGYLVVTALVAFIDKCEREKRRNGKQN